MVVLPQIVKNFATLHWIRSFIIVTIVFTEFPHWSQSSVSSIFQDPLSHFTHIEDSEFKVSVIQVFLLKPIKISLLPHACHMFFPTIIPSNDHQNNILWGVQVHRHYFVFITTGLQSFPKPVLHTMRHSVSSSNFQYPPFSLRYKIYKIRRALIKELRADKYQRIHIIIRCRTFFFQTAIQDIKLKMYRIIIFFFVLYGRWT
jgi:hypothetical protein